MFIVTSSICYGIKKIINRIWELGSDTWHELHQQYKHNDTTPKPQTQDEHDPVVEESYNLTRIQLVKLPSNKKMNKQIVEVALHFLERIS